jgi:hypothetical protein
MAAVKHLNIIRLLGVCLEPGETSLLMEFADLGTLRDQLDTEPPAEPLPAWRRFNLLFGVVSGMRRLHMHQPKPILHRDLKAMNVLIVSGPDGVWIAKIADFGLATGSGMSTSARSKVSGAGTISHSAPEVIDGGEFVCGSDVYGFGIIVFEVATDDIPFEDVSGGVGTVTRMVCDKKERPPVPTGPASSAFDQQQWEFLTSLIPGGARGGPPPGGCWAQEPGARPSFRELAHVFREAAPLFGRPQAAVGSGSGGKASAGSEQASRAFAAEAEMLSVIMEQVLGDKMESMEKRLMHGMYEATGVKTPTCFIIVPSKLERAAKAAGADGDLVQQTADGEDFELSAAGRQPSRLKQAEQLLARAKAGKSWFDKVCHFGSAVAEGRAGDAVSQAIDAFVTKETLYFYLVDEGTGQPVVPVGKSPYPIEIKKPKKVLPGLLPILHVGLRAMVVASGVANIGRAFGLPIPSIPESWHGAAAGMIGKLEQPSSVAAYANLQKRLDAAAESQPEPSAQAVRGLAQRQLEQFLAEHDPREDFAGLQRTHDSSGTAVWTLQLE